jgi:hypothetical protein
LVPDPENIDPDPGLIGSVTSGLAWLQRVYNDTFPGDTTTPLGHLQNFLAVPFQFTVLCLQLANSSFPAGVHSILPLPDDMATTAVGGDSMQRLSGKPWVVWLFTASAGRVVLAIGLIFAWMVVLGGHLPPHCSGVLELDFALKCGPDGHAEDEAAEEETTLLSKQGVPRNVSPWRMAGALRGLVARIRHGVDRKEIFSINRDPCRDHLEKTTSESQLLFSGAYPSFLLLQKFKRRAFDSLCFS